MPDAPQPIRFGLFELDPVARELRRNGARVKLQDQPFEVLRALIERPGEVVSKEELRERIWADDTYVDFDRSLATAVNKVRQALGDSATRPRFIETVPKRGYRFLHDLPEAGAVPEEPAVAEPAPRRWVPIAAVTGGTALLLAVGWIVWGRDSTTDAPARWSEPRRITSDSGLTFQLVISRDGTLLAYASDRSGEGNLDIWVQQTAGGEPVRITSGPADELTPDFSPDGKSVVFRSERGEGGIYLAPSLGGGSPRFVAPRGHRPRFSPNGEWIAYFTGPRSVYSLIHPVPVGEIYVVAATGGQPRRLATEAHFNRDPVWSPAGDSLLVASFEGDFEFQTLQWRRLDLDGSSYTDTGAVKEIRSSIGADSNPYPDYWDSDGFVYFSKRDADSAEIWRLRVPVDSGVLGRPEKVFSGTGFYREPSISVGGRLVFSSLSLNPDIWSLPLNADSGAAGSSGAIRLTTTAGDDGVPSISRDGRRVVFRSDRSGSLATWLLDFTSGQTRLLAEREGIPVIDSAGRRVAIGNAQDLTVVSSDGVVEGEHPPAYAWGWSPDDTMLLLSQPTLYSDLFLLEVETGRQTKLLSSPKLGFHQGRFSPDGRWVAAWTTDWEIVVAPFRGPEPIPESEWRPLSEKGSAMDKPRWSPNGKLLYHISDRDGFDCIYAQPLDDETRRAAGELLEIYHSHQGRQSISNVGGPALGIDVARDKIVFGMAELTGNIWMMERLE